MAATNHGMKVLILIFAGESERNGMRVLLRRVGERLANASRHALSMFASSKVAKACSSVDKSTCYFVGNSCDIVRHVLFLARNQCIRLVAPSNEFEMQFRWS